MMRSLTTFVLAAGLAVVISAQDAPVVSADFIGTWQVDLMGHQTALVIEPGKTPDELLGTFMLPGNRLLLIGTRKDRTVDFKRDKEATAELDAANGVASGAGGHDAGLPPAKPISVTLGTDGKLSGTMMTNRGEMRWVAEKLQAPKPR